MEHREDHNEIPEFTLEDILAEFGSGSDLYRTEDLPAEENSPEPAPAEAPYCLVPSSWKLFFNVFSVWKIVPNKNANCITMIIILNIPIISSLAP